MKKFAFYSSIILIALALSFYALFLIAKTQVVNTFGFVEKTNKFQYIFDSFRLHDIEFGNPFLEFVFVCDWTIMANGNEIKLKNGNEVMFISWKIWSDWSWKYPEGDYPPKIYDPVVNQKIEAYEKHIAKQNGE